MCFAIISPVNNIKTYWIKNSRTKNSSLPLTEKAPYNGYPEGTATVELLGMKEKYPEAKIAFVFPSKPDSYDEWVYPISHESGVTISRTCEYNFSREAAANVFVGEYAHIKVTGCFTSYS